MSRDLQIITKQGISYNLIDLGMTTKYFRPSSPSLSTETESVGDGEIDLGSNYTSRLIDAGFFVQAEDNGDFPLLVNEIFKIFQSKDSFYIIDSEMPGSRWEVKSNSDFTPDRIGSSGEFDIQFKSFSPFFHSIGTTLDPLTFDSDLWQFGQGLDLDEKDYIHTTSTFSVFNAGDEIIDPRSIHTPLLITFKGPSTGLSIKNFSTGDEWIYNASSGSLDTIRLDGVRSTKNGLSIFRDTNRKLIKIAPGWNDFEVNTGSSGSFEISFDFRFYYV
jgi:hypothetical protein